MGSRRERYALILRTPSVLDIGGIESGQGMDATYMSIQCAFDSPVLFR